MSSFEAYPIKFVPHFVRKLWGGDGINRHFKKGAPKETGESWELYDLPSGSSIIANGRFKRRTLNEVLAHHHGKLLGENLPVCRNFPLMIKFLDINTKLSLQVHPTDEYARRTQTGSSGKTECWYVIDCNNQSRVVRGTLPGTKKADFLRLLKEGSESLLEHLNVIKTQAKDLIYLPAGTVHSAWGGLIVLEIQNSCDITYRLSDWNRKDSRGKERRLDIETGVECMDFDSLGVVRVKPTKLVTSPFVHKLLLKTEKFTVESVDVKTPKKALLNTHGTFKIITVITGSGHVQYGRKLGEAESYKPGDTLLIPAALKEYRIAPRSETSAIISYC